MKNLLENLPGLKQLNGGKTYLAAVVLAALGLFAAVSGDAGTAVTLIASGLAAAGIGHKGDKQQDAVDRVEKILKETRPKQ